MYKSDEFFNVKDNAKIWPSNDPEDRPSQDYTCKLCGKTMTIGYDEAEGNERVQRHVRSHYLRFEGIIE